jgi:hypothetical protein
MPIIDQTNQSVNKQINIAIAKAYFTQETGKAGVVSLKEIFLSSTIEDLDAYRSPITQFLAEVDITIPHPKYLDKLAPEERQGKLRSADAYIGLVGHWYGDVIPAYHKSFVHLEFQWAYQHWLLQKPRRLVVFQPDRNSQADIELHQRADELIGANRQDHETFLEAFRKELTGGRDGFRWVDHFTDKGHLLAKVLQTCVMWQKPLTAAAEERQAQGSGESAPRPTVPIEDLGSLGRGKQVDLVTSILLSLNKCSDIPAAALLVHGPPQAGQTEFLHHLVTLHQLKRGRPPKRAWGSPADPSASISRLTEWVGQVLGLPGQGEDSGIPEKLAERVYTQLKKQQLCFILDDVERINGGVTAFQQQFWQPFYNRLKDLAAQQSLPNRLIAIVVDYTGQRQAWQELACLADQPVASLDFARLLELPALTPFTEEDFANWFPAFDLSDERRLELWQLAEDFTTPADVLNWLRYQDLGVEGDMIE